MNSLNYVFERNKCSGNKCLIITHGISYWAYFTLFTAGDYFRFILMFTPKKLRPEIGFLAL